ncbi:MAG: S8 family peptidase [Cytophagales bacterium]|nr:S8 family peptidase [Bernardetiaceae bacterium]MDW8203524.1 S8 family peptidase [Cytophagales bacterium]
MPRLFVFLALIVCSTPLWGQARQVHLVFFRDKRNSPFSLNRPQEFLTQRSLERRQRQNIPLTGRDLPVSPAYLDSIRKTGARVLYPTRWLNGAIISATEAQIAAVNRLSVVLSNATQRLSRTEQSGQSENTATTPEADWSAHYAARVEATEAFNYGFSERQVSMLGVDAMHRAGFRGEEIHIAVLDCGFQGFNTALPFRNMTVLGTFNFVEGTPNVINSCTHGTRVLSALAAFQEGSLIGTAPRAAYYLFQTEDNATETRAEEAWWLAAAERADSLGVDIISTSVGYYHFDDPAQNYTLNDLNGRTAIITRAANAAASVGILVVKSAGNQGNRAWGRITFPGDADSVLTVGSVNSSGVYSAFSSRGPTADGRIKPDVVALGEGTIVSLPSGTITGDFGTSFATPLVAGLAAGFWQANRQLSNMQVIDYIRRSGTRARNPNDSVGYGIPHFERMQLLVTALSQQPVQSLALFVYPNPAKGETKIVFPETLHGKPVELVLVDISGKQHLRLHLLPSLEPLLLRAPLAKGLYWLQITNQHHRQTIPLVFD